MTRKIPYLHIRGGSSKGLYFNAADLPNDITERNKVLIQAMEGSMAGDLRQIDGLGGGSPLSSKVAIISRSPIADADLDYDFVQVIMGKGMVSSTQTCGNILAGVLHYAIHTGMVDSTSPTTSAIVRMINTGGRCEVIVETPDGQITTKGDAKVDGVVGTSAPILCNYLDIEGATCGELFPTGNKVDTINNISVTCIDNGMPLAMMLASDFNLSGHESVDELDSNVELKNQLEAIRLQMGTKMNLGDVKDKTIPKMCLVSRAQFNGDLCTRMFIPHAVHEAIGVLAAVSVATAFLDRDTVCARLDPLLDADDGRYNKQIIIEHPTGDFTVNLLYDKKGSDLSILKSGVVRTARMISEGSVFIED